MGATVLVVEDEPQIQELIAVNLQHVGHHVLRASSAEEADRAIREQLPDVLVLDWMLPGESGLAFARRLRSDERTRDLPILMLTARAMESDKLSGLESGADDYLTKPFSPRELAARIKAVLRRRAPQLSGDVIEVQGLRLDPASHRVTAGVERVSLSPAEFRLLHFLMTHPGRVYSRTQLLDHVWGDHVYIEERTVDVHIRRLRKALEPSGHDRLIDTVRGSGYGLLERLSALWAWGWALLAAALAIWVVLYRRQLRRLERWLEDPAAGKVPEASGTWDRIFARLHRFERDAASREAALAEALVRFRRAAQALPDGVVILNAEHRIEWCNDRAAAMLELDPHGDLGQPIVNLVRHPGFVDYLALRERAESDAIRVPAAKGTVYSLQLIPYGRAQALLLCRDVTQAERVETMRRDFVANVSHELRTPLTVLVGFLETVRELKLDPQRVRDYVGMMREQASRMHRIIEDLLTLSVLESAPPPVAERVRVGPLLERLRADAEALSAGRHQISLQASPHADLAGSEVELSSAFGNLVSNAVRYTPAGGTVRLAWREGPEGATFVVEDTGPGIAPEHIPRLTERFYRVDRGRSRESGGTGLGLAIVKHAVARHQAALDIESREGEGSRFSVRFPRERLIPTEPAAATNP